MSDSKEILNVGVLGWELLAAGWFLLQSAPEFFNSRAGKHIEVVAACVRDPKKIRPAVEINFLLLQPSRCRRRSKYRFGFGADRGARTS